MKIKARAPLRLGLAGGGTDVSPYSEEYGGAVLNITIDRYAYSTIQLNENENFIFEATDKSAKVFFNSESCLNNDSDNLLPLHIATYQFIIKEFNEGIHIPMNLTTFCDAPIGSGLGASSTLVVSMVKCFTELLNLPLGEYDIAKVAFKIEREICGFKGGKQDQYAATFGGVNYMEFGPSSVTVINPLRIKNWILNELEASFLLFYTGVSRESARIIESQSNYVIAQNSKTIDAMHNLKLEAQSMKIALLKGDFEGIVQSMISGWESKRKTSDRVSSPHIDSIFKSAIEAGALAGKVSGAGGGGFMMFYVPIEKRMSVINTLSSFSGEVRHCHFTDKGCQAWKLK